jgi:hypothetical protein
MTSTIKGLVRKVGLGSFRNVQPQIWQKWVGQPGVESSLRLPSGQSVQPLIGKLQLLRDSGEYPCPSGSLYLKELKMDDNVYFIWLPIDRVAELMEVSVKTIRRMIKANQLVSLIHQIPTMKGKSSKTFILADEQLVQREYWRFRQTLIQPDLWYEEDIILGEPSDEDDSNRFRSVFLVYLDNDLPTKTNKEQVKKVIRKHNRNSARGQRVSLRKLS